MNDDPRDTKVVLITGTSTGIGLELAVELAKRGARVFASMRDVKKAAALQLAATIAGVAVELVALDVTSDESVREAVAHVEFVAGRIDVVVSNAAVAT
jgi:NAD(P)-dependent dehydrogenase (short-subunit alcohol dehydrogenase family)